MIDVLQSSARIYRRTLAFYPEDLLREFGPEMALVFDEDLARARRQAGMRGVVRVWRQAIGEFVRYALPGRLSGPAFRVPAISLAVFVAATFPQALMAYHFKPNLPAFFHTLAVSLILPILAAPAVSLMAVWVCRGRDALSLGLSDAAGKGADPCWKSAS
ncbi:MAG TPA: hypothetical protein VMH28_23390 [Candidatus Acidoferrales bacterium]|nr:hypothetical protein [Candidatus Acidoferrales bacterium]